MMMIVVVVVVVVVGIFIFYYYGIPLADNYKQGTTLVLFGIIILVATVQLLYALPTPIKHPSTNTSIHSLSHVLKIACAVKQLWKSNDYDKISSNYLHVSRLSFHIFTLYLIFLKAHSAPCAFKLILSLSDLKLSSVRRWNVVTFKMIKKIVF